MTKLKAITQPLSLAKVAYKALRDSILTGHLIPGEMYNEIALAKELGISRTPVREALLELSTQGLVTFLPRKGVMVSHYDRRDVEEIFELRKAIELAAIEKVANASPPCDLSKIQKALADQRKAIKKKDFLAFLQADRVFHATLSELTNNRRLVDILDNIRDLIQLMGREALGRAGRWEEVLAEHKKVFEAVKEGKPAETREAMVYHLDRSKEAVVAQTSAEEKERREGSLFGNSFSGTME
ncbi:MAG: GntR family transcriptional regulator [Desulfobacteraceae bacterium]|nr:GntR family transcriptional regulator [Desulfobacteraceae bacterium]